MTLPSGISNVAVTDERRNLVVTVVVGGLDYQYGHILINMYILLHEGAWKVTGLRAGSCLKS